MVGIVTVNQYIIYINIQTFLYSAWIYRFKEDFNFICLSYLKRQTSQTKKWLYQIDLDSHTEQNDIFSINEFWSSRK